MDDRFDRSEPQLPSRTVNGGPGAEAMTQADVQAAFCATLVDEWVRCGIAHAVVCPGSRSTPLALAIAAEPRMKLHVRLDERSAGFSALGIGMATGAPAVVVVTSGTAAAELHAAVVEADLAGVPLVVCTADRPPELRDVGAPQTIDQIRLFGRAVRWFDDPGVPADSARSSWRSLACRAVAESRGGMAAPGPVHLNLAFREPLVGSAVIGGVEAGRPDGAPWHQVLGGDAELTQAWIRALVDGGPLDPARRGVVVAGEGCGDPVGVLDAARALGWPVLADPRSGLRVDDPLVIATADALVRVPEFAEAHRPEVVLRLGARWASKVVAQFLAEGDQFIVEPTDQWTDPERTADHLVRCRPEALCRGLAHHLAGRLRPDTRWLESWTAGEATVRQVLEEQLALGAGSGEPALAFHLWRALPAGVDLMVSSSMPIRDLEAFGLPRHDPPRVFSNRGANGIDGVVSTGLGVALASGPTVVLVGDLAFLHDVSALVGPATDRPPLIIVVADNGGGGIFSFLPQADTLDERSFEQLFGTPQQQDVARVAAGFGWPVEVIDATTTSGLAGLHEGVSRLVATGTAGVLHVVLPDREANVVEHRRLHEAVADALGGRAG